MYMNTKLTLSIEEQVVDEAKKYASKQHTSLSNLVENYLKSLVNKKDKNLEEYSSIVQSLKSSFAAEEGLDYKKELTKRLSDKYL